MQSASQRLAEWVSELRFDDVPAGTISYAKELVLDHLGCAARGGVTDTGRTVDATLENLHAHEGVTTTVVGKRPARPEWAILANGVAAHTIEMDDTHTPGSLHPAVVVIPAALAVAELRGSRGDDFLTAVVAGYEVAGRLGRALEPGTVYDRGFHPTAVVGACASAAAAGKLLGLTADQITQAFGIATTQASGLMEFVADGTWTKRLHPGWAGHAGFLAAQLARTGFTGPGGAFEGRDGLLRAFGSAASSAAVAEGLGSSLELDGTSIKPHACCRYNQGAIDLAIALAAEHKLHPDDVERVRVDVVSHAIGIVVEPPERKLAPQSGVDAQFSLPYAIGVAVATGRASLDEYADDMLTHPGVLAVAARVEARARPDFDERFPRYWPTEVSIETRDGRTVTASTEAPKGDPDNPLTADELRAKFRSLAEPVFDDEALAGIEQAVAGVDRTDVSVLLDALGRSRDGAAPADEQRAAAL